LNNAKTFAALLMLLLFFTAMVSAASGSEPASSVVVFPNSGTIISLPPPIGKNNLAVLPDFFLGTGWDIDGIYTKYPVTWQGKANCIEMDYSNTAASPDNNRIGELDGHWLAIKPGDHIVWRAWLYAEDQTSGDISPWRGAILHLDLYDDKRIAEIGGTQGQPSYIPSTNTWVDRTGCVAIRGTNQWILAEIDFIVQSQYEADGFGSYPAGELHTPKSFVVIVLNGASSDYVSTERGRIWIWNPELYINP
jgi:hypothetical protein